jgi:hypothetical protein
MGSVTLLHQMAAKRGRPKGEVQRDRRLVLRVTPEQEARIRELAAKENMSLADWMRSMLVMGEITARTDPAGMAKVLAQVAKEEYLGAEEMPLDRVVKEPTRDRRTILGKPAT